MNSKDSALAIGPPRCFPGYDPDQARLFAASWLPAWTSTDPQRLGSFYAGDTYYADPEVPNGLRGRNALVEYLIRLLARSPDWVWRQARSSPMRGGFVNHRHADIPVRRVELRRGLIARGGVFIDGTPLTDALRSRRNGR